MNYSVMDDELVSETIVYWNDCVKKLRETDYGRELYDQIVEPPQVHQGKDKPDGYLINGRDPPKKGTLVDGDDCRYSLSTISKQREISGDEKFGDQMSLWEAFELVGLINICKTPSGHRVSRNEALCEIKRNDELISKDLQNPDSAATEAEADDLEKKRLLISRFGLNLLNRFAPERLSEYPADAYPSAYIGTKGNKTTPLEVLMAVKAEIEIPATLKSIEVRTGFEKDTRRTTNNQNYWQIVNEVDIKLSEITPVSGMEPIKRYLREETNRILQVAVSIDDFYKCSCGSIKSHTRAAYGNLLIGAVEPLSGDSDIREEEHECSLASSQKPLIEPNLTEGKVHYAVTWDGIKGGQL